MIYCDKYCYRGIKFFRDVLGVDRDNFCVGRIWGSCFGIGGFRVGFLSMCI